MMDIPMSNRKRMYIVIFKCTLAMSIIKFRCASFTNAHCNVLLDYTSWCILVTMYIAIFICSSLDLTFWCTIKSMYIIIFKCSLAMFIIKFWSSSFHNEHCNVLLDYTSWCTLGIMYIAIFICSSLDLTFWCTIKIMCIVFSNVHWQCTL